VQQKNEVPGGVSTTAELRAAGLSTRRIRLLVHDGALRPVLHGVYVSAEFAASAAGGGPATSDRRRAESPTDPGDSHLVKVAAALAVTGAHSVGSHRSAAQVNGLSLLRSRAADLVHVTRAPTDRGSRTGRPGVRVHQAALPDGHVTRRQGVPVTSVSRTVVDLARTLPFAEGVVVADSALAAKQTTSGELEAVVAQCVRWPGIQRARRVVMFADQRAESPLESISRAVFHELGLPPPELQVWVGDEDGVAGRVDFLWRQYRTIAEADGAIKYTRPAEAMAQLNRDARLRAAGFEVVHFTWREIIRVPAQVVADIRAAFRQGGGTQRQ
jgi:Protein of unknown function (DUF559)/Transcriptional regulator, AbiEi antitoxin